MPENTAGSERSLQRFLIMAGLAAALFIVASQAAEPPARAVTGRTSYNVGETVRLRIVPPETQEDASKYEFFVTVRYAGEDKPVLERVPLPPAKPAADGDDYHDIWQVPRDARTGRYEIDLAGRDSQSGQEIVTLPRAATFAVHRKLVRIERVELDKTFYAPGDPVACRVVLRNLSNRPLTNLRVEFSERYWPWIAQSSEREGVDVFPVVKAITLQPGKEVEVRSARAATVKAVEKPAVQQYAVVVWDQQRQTVHDIAFSALTFIQPVGSNTTRPYPLQYVYRDLESVDTSSYRNFFRPAFGSTAVQFDSSHTMYAPGDTAMVKFTVTNSTDQAWHAVKIQAGLRALGSGEFGRQIIEEKVDLGPRGARLEREAKFTLPADGPGTYRVVVEVSDSEGEVLAAGQLELAANPMPKSILIFCAHEDDEGAHSGIIRAAVENNIPLNLVYFTSGDAGSCDRYYEHSCSPAESLNFGGLRMDETRAALAHLGVPRENIHFLGLPDGGSGEIWFHHQELSHPYLSVLLASEHAPYEGLARPNLTYARRAVVEETKEFIKKFQPEVIYTGHPDERHVDHRTNNWFVVKAMQELLREALISPKVELRVDQVYGPGPQKHAPYHYEKHTLFVTPEVRSRAQEAVWFYQSQGGNRRLGRITPFEKLRRPEVHSRVLDWNEHEGWNEAME